MHKRQALATFISLGVLATAAFPQSRWVPFTAKFTISVDNVDASGRHNLTNQQGVRLRSSDGRTLEYTFTQGTAQICCGTLNVPDNGVIYRLDYLTKRAVGTKMPNGHRGFPKMDILGHDTIAGMPAVGYPMLDAKSNRPDGEIWFASSDPDLVLRIKKPLPSGGLYTSEITEIQYGSEPDAAQLQIPAGMEVAKPQ